jgi:hypothetical protein
MSVVNQNVFAGNIFKSYEYWATAAAKLGLCSQAKLGVHERRRNITLTTGCSILVRKLTNTVYICPVYIVYSAISY